MVNRMLNLPTAFLIWGLAGLASKDIPDESEEQKGPTFIFLYLHFATRTEGKTPCSDGENLTRRDEMFDET